MKQALDTIKTIIEQKSNLNSDTMMVTKITHELANPADSLIVLEYFKVLIWPCIILIVILLFRKKLLQLLDRIIHESAELNSSFLGLNATFREEIKDSENSINYKEKIDEAIQKNIKDEFKLLASYFFTKPLEIRKRTATEVMKLSRSMTIEELLNFATSLIPGERVAAYIGITTHLKLFPDLSKQEDITDIIQHGLDDGFSRVRYRVIQAIGCSEHLITIFRNDLIKLYKDETNQPVKRLLKEILK